MKSLLKKVTTGVRGLLLTVRWLGLGPSGGCIAVWSNGSTVGSSSPALFEGRLVKLHSQFLAEKYGVQKWRNTH